MDQTEIVINDEIVERLKRVIIMKESQNLKTKSLSDEQMVAWIKKKIEEELQCYLNQ